MTTENTQTEKTSAMDVIAMLLKENNDLRREMLLMVSGNGNIVTKKGVVHAAKPVVDTVTGKFYHAESAAGLAVAREENIKDLFTADGRVNSRVFYSIPDYGTRFVPYVGAPLTKEDNGKVVQPPKAKVAAPAAAAPQPVTPQPAAPVTTVTKLATPATPAQTKGK